MCDLRQSAHRPPNTIAQNARKALSRAVRTQAMVTLLACERNPRICIVVPSIHPCHRAQHGVSAHKPLCSLSPAKIHPRPKYSSQYSCEIHGPIPTPVQTQ